MNSQAAEKEMKKGGKMPPKGHKEILGMHFKPMKNGMSSEVQHRTFRGGQGGGPSHEYSEDLPVMHPSMNHAMKHLKATMGHLYGNPMPEKETDSAPEPAAEMPAENKMDLDTE